MIQSDLQLISDLFAKMFERIDNVLARIETIEAREPPAPKTTGTGALSAITTSIEMMAVRLINNEARIRQLEDAAGLNAQQAMDDIPPNVRAQMRNVRAASARRDAPPHREHH